jgi:hypothetical protein
MYSRLGRIPPKNNISHHAGAPMNPRAIHELPVPILTDDELLAEYAHTFSAVLGDGPEPSASSNDVETVLRRNSATMGELLRRGYRSAEPRWYRSNTE